jgi:plasmid stability protein
MSPRLLMLKPSQAHGDSVSVVGAVWHGRLVEGEIRKALRIGYLTEAMPQGKDRCTRTYIEDALNEGARDTGRPISDPANFASRPWTRADDDELRKLALRGLSVRAIGSRTGRTETAVRSRARRLQVIFRKIMRIQLQMG